MKHKIKFETGEEKILEARVEKFCESVGFDNVINITHSVDPEGWPLVMIHYQSEN